MMLSLPGLFEGPTRSSFGGTAPISNGPIPSEKPHKTKCDAFPSP